MEFDYQSATKRAEELRQTLKSYNIAKATYILCNIVK